MTSFAGRFDTLMIGLLSGGRCSRLVLYLTRSEIHNPSRFSATLPVFADRWKVVSWLLRWATEERGNHDLA